MRYGSGGLARWILAAWIVFAPIPLFAQGPVDEGPWLTPEQGGTIRALAALALERTAQAEQVLQKATAGESMRLLDEARRFLTQIEAVRPTAEAKALLGFVEARLEVEQNIQALPDLLPLRNALRNLPFPVLGQRALAQLDAATGALEAGERKKARDALESLDRLLIIQGVDFPLSAANQQLRDAANAYAATDRLPDREALRGVEANLLSLIASPAVHAGP